MSAELHMVTREPARLFDGAAVRVLYIVTSRRWWIKPPAEYDPRQDVVLTYDFGLQREIDAGGGRAAYIDHLRDPETMQENNFRMYRFFREWHLNGDHEDIFTFRDIPFGFAFRIEIWNDFTFYVRTRLCLEQIRALNPQRIVVSAGDTYLESMLAEMGFASERMQLSAAGGFPEYFFPIHRWMNEKLRVRRWRHVVRDVVTTCQGLFASYFDRLPGRRARIGVYVQEYHPTRVLLQRLLRWKHLRVVQGHFSAEPGLSKFWRERPIPVYGSVDRYRLAAEGLLEDFRRRRVARLVLSNGLDVSEEIYRVLEQCITPLLPGMLRSLECVVRHVDRHPLRLEILIGNLGQLAMLVDAVAKQREVPSYLIINGLLYNAYMDEGKYATMINAYSKSICENYFRGMTNVVCLGDPRMDDYADETPHRIDRENPVITIGTSGFNNIDLNSYLAVEFEFMHEVLAAISAVVSKGYRCRVRLKVRPNGYATLYRNFVDEFYPGLVEAIEDVVPMRKVLGRTDFYISIYSQTLFEASCLGIPCVYHKTDVEVMDPPFDGKSELVTTSTVAELVAAVVDFYGAHPRFDAFATRSVMEKYIGPLDGGNLERNLDFVRQMLEDVSGDGHAAH